MEKITPTLPRLFLLHALTLLLVYSPLQAYQAQFPLLATGYYFDGEVRRALMIQSLDGGISWQYPSSVHEDPLPFDFLDGGLSKSACNKSVCIATGNYYNSELNPMPLLLQSTYLGHNWSYEDMLSSTILPVDFQKGWFNDSFCKDTQCFAVGLYENNKGALPLLALQNTDSKTWSYIDLLAQNSLPGDFQEGWFETISCGNTSCIAAGTYLDASMLRHPLLIESKDEGLTWKPAVIKGKLTQHNDAFLYASTCNRMQCFAVGSYKDPSSPVLMQSSIKDQAFHAAPFNLPSDYKSGWFNDVDCKDDFCIAVGTYYNGKEHSPLLIFSNDSGAHWKLQEPYVPSGESTDGQYSSAACNKMGCIAGGYSTNYNGIYPLITVSHDRGLTWEYPASAQVSVPQAELGNGFFRTVTCHENSCIASGDYTIDSAYYPLLALSLDGGITWDFPASIMDPEVLPANFVNGHF